jgi:sugar lactone lactonase YvrE
VAGRSTGGFVDGPAATAAFDGPGAITYSNGALYVGEDRHGAIRQIDLGAGQVTTIVDGGLGWPNGLIVVGSTLYAGDGFGDAINSVALPSGAVSPFVPMSDSFSNLDVEGFAFDGNQTLYASDQGDGCIATLTLTGALTQLAGNCAAGSEEYADGVGAAAIFDEPSGVAMDPSGNLYVADKDNNVIRKVTANGTVTTFAGNQAVFAPDDTDGPPLQALFDGPLAMAGDSKGNLFVSDFWAMRKIEPLPDGGYWVHSFAAYNGTTDPVTGIAGIALDEDGGNLYVTASNLNQIWVFRGF